MESLPFFQSHLNLQNMVEVESERWRSKGINIKYEIRENRNGFKAGNLKEGMKHSYVEQCDYVAIFDADFQPEPDILCRTIPYLFHNPRIALVQARWTFVNADECLMTRMQEMSLDYHFTMEQEVGSATYAFFGFNVFVPEVEVPKWVAIYLPSTITLLNAFGTPRSLRLLVFWILFENVMSLHRTEATCTGLLEIGRVNEFGL